MPKHVSLCSPSARAAGVAWSGQEAIRCSSMKAAVPHPTGPGARGELPLPNAPSQRNISYPQTFNLLRRPWPGCKLHLSTLVHLPVLRASSLRASFRLYARGAPAVRCSYGEVAAEHQRELYWVSLSKGVLFLSCLGSITISLCEMYRFLNPSPCTGHEECSIIPFIMPSLRKDC